MSALKPSTTQIISLKGAHIVAAITPEQSCSPFSQADVIVRSAGGKLVRPQIYGNGRILGLGLSIRDLDDLVAAGQAIVLPTSHAYPWARVWVFRKDFPGRKAAIRFLNWSGVLVREPIDGPDQSLICLVDPRHEKAAMFLARWSRYATQRSVQAISSGDWEVAALEADLAQVLVAALWKPTGALAVDGGN